MEFNCEALGLIPRRLRRNSKAFFINQYPAPWGGVVNFIGSIFSQKTQKAGKRPAFAHFPRLGQRSEEN
jgi:hypothetical protein